MIRKMIRDLIREELKVFTEPKLVISNLEKPTRGRSTYQVRLYPEDLEELRRLSKKTGESQTMLMHAFIKFGIANLEFREELL